MTSLFDNRTVLPMKKVAFLLLRWSMKRQGEETKTSIADSRRRHLKKSRQWCEENGYTLSDEVFVADGHSAYPGEHAEVDKWGTTKAALAEFLAPVEDGAIKKRSILLLESHDRFARRRHRESLDLLLTVITAGIGLLFTGSWRPQIIDADLIEKDGHILQMVVGDAIRSHAESAWKSARVKEGKQERLRPFRQGDILLHNNVPKYLSYDKDTTTYRMTRI